ncbi:MAG TPA: TlpA disulfide reductase family protein [Candidatus Sulfotelmatobacter sp.]|nr:TlpA disulfide reductase family protein [Candidatus Sulfotelmatobacter sp.]
MTALATGIKAPDFSLKTLDGTTFSLAEALSHGPVVLAFFKVSCPTCQYAFPFLQRLYKAYGKSGVSLLGVSQNDAAETAAFNKDFGVTFPVLLDAIGQYPVSNAYGLTNVPTVFWIAQDGEIEVSSVGWVKADFEQINRKMADAGKSAPAAVFKQGEEVRDFRAG